ncbi:cysteine proteinase [Amniculicola lignicola CBS 123094]|uniref:ubiquitinyl hydrolase 1 n=1 Tax=Amniculicola lignicola CBS 123094 TaxID=1392246 RepID=A0A6A5X523_9PLEO|nr:cysteine proteinase [Amniculicola lignicola CBS 123094]
MASRPGKTAPRLLQDLLTYDARHEERAGRNLLTSSPPHFDPDTPPEPAVPNRNCRHIFMTKPEQSVLPVGGEDTTHNTVYKIASFCQKCRFHLQLVVDFRDHGSKTLPCRTASDEFPIHHFVYHPAAPATNGHQHEPHTHAFQCTAPKCPVEVRIRLLPPRFTDSDIHLLTNKVALKKRLDAAKEMNLDRADAHTARCVDALDFLSTYLQDSLSPKQGKARIPLLNRKFLKTFGKDCDAILKSLGFTQAVELEDDGPVEVWHLPKPPAAARPLDSDTTRTVIEDARYELNSLIMKFPESERTNVRHVMFQPQPSINDIQRALGCLDYGKRPMTRAESRADNRDEDHPYYAGLGAVGDFNDALLLFAFARQSAVDTRNSTYYFECLQGIAIGRKSPVLEEQVMVMASQGFTNRKEVEDAYRYLGLDPSHKAALTDDIIISQFRARLGSISPAVVDETRSMLRIIGNARGSNDIIQEASNAIESYKQALNWLELEESQQDEFVVTMYTLKTHEHKSSIPTARKAVEIIAEARNSERLREFLESGELKGDATMDLGEAYALLQINDRTILLDEEVLLQQLTLAIQDSPEREAVYREAYDLIRADQKKRPKNSQTTSGSPRKVYPLAIWPVGCENIGNTCYLNSVLQFLFTIKPLRDMVLDCDRHFQELTHEALKDKLVGRSAVTAEKVEKAQQFVRELRKLFECMITASTSHVRPETQLAALALVRPDTVVPNTSAVDNLTSNLGQLNEDAQAMELTNSTDDDIGNADRPEPPSRPPPVPPRPQTSAQANIKAIEGYAQQHDAAEILNNIFDLFSSAFKGNGVLRDGEQNDLIKELFFSDVTTVMWAGEKINRNIALQDNHLISPGNRDRPLYAALDDEFSLTELDHAEEGEVKRKYDFMSKASPIQIINVRRLVLENKKVMKDDSHVALAEILYLDRYLGHTDSLSEQQLRALKEKQWHLRQKLKDLKARKQMLEGTEVKLSLSASVNECSNLIESLHKQKEDNLIDVDDDPLPPIPDIHGYLAVKAQALREEEAGIEAEMKEVDQNINNIFSGCKDHPYRLHSVFMHRGSSAGGHYWIFIYDFQNKIWRKYNDDYVDKVEDLDAIFKKEVKNPATSTGIVYVREDKINEYTQAVCREPERNASPEIQMIDAPDTTEYENIPVINGIAKES